MIPSQAESPQSKLRPKGKTNARNRPEGLEKRRKPKAVPHQPAKRRTNPIDVNYDGYYDDVKPVDAGELDERMDPELIKKVAILLAGVLVVIIASVVLMTLL